MTRGDTIERPEYLSMLPYDDGPPLEALDKLRDGLDGLDQLLLPAEDVGGTFCCTVCYEEGTSRPLVCCRPAVCSACFDRHVQQTLLLGPVRCPAHECRRAIPASQIQGNVLPTTLLQVEEAALQQSTSRWCPVPRCSAPLPAGQAGRRVECAECGAKSCMRCKGADHWGPCFASRDDGAVQSWQMTKDAKSCPKCSKLIEKNGGCMHMTCRRPAGCGHEFCWLCLQDHHNHYVALCAPLAVWHGSNKWFGPVWPVRLVTKTAFVGVAVGLAGAALGLAVAGGALVVAFSPAIGLYKLYQKRKRDRLARQRHLLQEDYGSSRSRSGEEYMPIDLV